MEYKVIDGKGIIPDRAKEIVESAFKSCTCLQSIVIPNSVTKIGKSAFDGCTSLQSIVIPNSVTTIEEWTFYGCIYNHRTTKTNQKYPSVNL